MKVEILVWDVVERSWWMGDWSQPCCPATMPPEVAGVAATVGDAAAAAAAHAAGQGRMPGAR